MTHSPNLNLKVWSSGFSRRVRKIAKNDCWLRHVCPSVCMEQLGSNRTDFHEIWYLKVTGENLPRKFKFHYILTTITGTLHEDRYTFFVISRSVLLRMGNVSDKICRENQNTHFVFRDPPPKKIAPLRNNVEKYCRAGQATDDNMAHAHCMLDTKGYKHTLTICNTYCFSSTTVVTRTRLCVTLYVHWLSCYNFV
jgi:hypothetical protein